MLTCDRGAFLGCPMPIDAAVGWLLEYGYAKKSCKILCSKSCLIAAAKISVQRGLLQVKEGEP